MNVTCDWEWDAWTILPLGVKVAKLVKFLFPVSSRSSTPAP
jgi:hypothetical protein